MVDLQLCRGAMFGENLDEFLQSCDVTTYTNGGAYKLYGKSTKGEAHSQVRTPCLTEENWRQAMCGTHLDRHHKIILVDNAV